MTQHIPTVAIIGKKGRLIVNEVDLPDWRRKGYKTETEIKIAQVAKDAEKTPKE